MIKGILESDDGDIVLIGLSGENIARLYADEPIMFDMAEMGLAPQRVCIVVGETEQAILDYLRTKVPIIIMPEANGG